VRVNFNYFISEPVFHYVVQAVDLIATAGWKLLPQYRFDTATGRWHHRGGPVEPPLRLRQLHYDEHGVLSYPQQRDQAPESALADYLAEACALLESLPIDILTEGSASLSEDFEHLRWFDLPSLCLEPATSPGS
jgi:hypothetical protein